MVSSRTRHRARGGPDPLSKSRSAGDEHECRQYGQAKGSEPTQMQQSESLAVRSDSVCAVAARVSRSSLRIPPSFDERSLRIQGIDRECGVDAVPVRVDLSGDFDPGREVLPHRDDLVGRGQQPSKLECSRTAQEPLGSRRRRHEHGRGSPVKPGVPCGGERHREHVESLCLKRRNPRGKQEEQTAGSEGSRWSWRLERHACHTGHRSRACSWSQEAIRVLGPWAWSVFRWPACACQTGSR